MPSDTPARSAMSWSLALASPRSPKTRGAALRICSGLSSGHLGYFGAHFSSVGLALGIHSAGSN